MKMLYKRAIENQTVAYETFSGAIDISRCDGYSLHAIWTNVTPSAHTFVAGDVNTTTSVITENAHGLQTGMVGQFTTTTTLPSGLSLATNYYVVVVSANTYKVATSLANAIAGTTVTISSGGTGTHTFTPTALAGNLKLQGSIDGVTYTDVSGGTTALSALAAFINVPNVYYPYVRIAVSPTAGVVRVTSGDLFAKGY
jgi:hypothetical protein